MLVWEALRPALAPAFGILALFVALALLGLIAALPPWGHAALLALLAAALGGTLWRRGRSIAWPGAAAAARRLEAASGLAHAPLSVLSDRPAAASADAPLWRAHRGRAAAALGGLTVPWPRPGRDRFGLGGLAAVGLVASLVIAGPQAWPRLIQALTWPRDPAPPGATITAWIAPPAYTGLAPLTLRPGRAVGPVPEGAVLRVTIAGGGGRAVLRLGGRALPVLRRGAGAIAARVVLTQSGVLRLGRGRVRERWRLKVVAPTAPVLGWTAPPGALAADPRLTRLPWRARDAYGIVRLAVRLRLQARSGSRSQVLSLHPRSPRRGGGPVVQTGVALRDLTADPWAGLAVVARLVAANGAGLSARGPAATFVLPARRFRDPLARRLIALRQRLSLQPDAREAVAAALRAIPGAAFASAFGAYLETRADAARLRAGAGLGSVQTSLWRVALGLEDRARAPAARRLARARRAADAAQRRAAANPSAANRAALGRRLAALERALVARAKALARQLRAAGLTPAQARALVRGLARRAGARTRAATDAARAGAMDRAGKALRALDRLADRLQDSPQALAAARRELATIRRTAKLAGAMRRLLAGEVHLLTRAHRRLDAAAVAATIPLRVPPRGAPILIPPPGAPTGPQVGSAARARDRTAQLGLRGDAGRLRARLARGTGMRAALAQARTAMAAAAGALGANRDALAEAAERQAVAALRQGGQALARAMAHAGGPAGGPAGGQAGGGGAALSIPGLGALMPVAGDPMGRVRLPANPRLRRTRAIETTLHRREAEPDRPVLERDYLRRLLRGF